MDLQRRISRLLAITGTALLISGVVSGAFIGDAGAAAKTPPDQPEDHPGTTATTSDATTSSTRKKPRSSTTTTTEHTHDRAAATTSTSAAPTTTTMAPTTTTTKAPTTTTTASGTSAQGPGQDPSGQDQDPSGQGQDPSGQSQGSDPGASQSHGQAPNQGATAAQVAPTTSSTVNAPVSRGPKSPVPPGQPPAAPVTSTTVANPVPPVPVANPLPRTPITALSGPPPNPVTLDAVQESPPVGPQLPPWDTQATTPESENPRQAAGAAAAPTRRPSGQLSMTGSATRTLLFLAGVALLLGAVAVALGEPGPLRTAHAAARTKTPKARTRKLRRTIPGWESGVPLAPTRRAAKRSRLERRGVLDLSRPGDEPAA
ncbi:MAG: hypothetical protein ACRD0O_18505 [Acidimicrobiia bacterium]